MKKRKVLFVDSTHSELWLLLEKQLFVCDIFNDYNRSDYKKIAHNYCGIIIRSKIKLDADFIDACTNLKFIGRVGAGMENIDSDYASKKGIICLNAPEGNRDAVGEQAIAMLLALFNNLLIADPQVRKGIWIREGNRGLELSGKTVGIIGYGNTGGAFARKLSGFNVNVLAFDKYKTGFSDAYATESSMDELYERSDIVSMHIPLADETRYMVNKEYINRFKKNIYLINTSRGKILLTSDLVELLNDGKVLGACLDVLEYEGISFENVDLPDDFNRLISRSNIIVSPHIAGWTHESNYKMAVTLAKKVEALKI